MILNARQTISVDLNPAGAMNKKQIQTPNAQYKLMSLEDFLFITRTISGIFHNGNAIAAMNATVSINIFYLLALHCVNNLLADALLL